MKASILYEINEIFLIEPFGFVEKENSIELHIHSESKSSKKDDTIYNLLKNL